MILVNQFRPWGELDWVISKLGRKNWSFLGCLSSEERCLGAYDYLKQNNFTGYSLFLEIIDPGNPREHKLLRDHNRVRLQSIDASVLTETHQLLEPLNNIVQSLKSFISKSRDSVILDISSFPKRFFFPLLKFILKDKNLKDLMVTYTGPKSYSEADLSNNPQPWMHIPGFKSDDEDGSETAIIGVGFMPLGLPDVLRADGTNNMQVKYFFPFPPGPPFYQRTWNLVKSISDYRPILARELVRIDAMNVPEVYDKIQAISDWGKKKVYFAPFGPKTFSLAMCLHACNTNSSVYYTQPMSYSARYSEGTGNTFSYCIILNGINLYMT